MTALTQFCGDRLRDARLARGLTGSALAERIGVSSASISQYEHGDSRPQPQVLARLAEKLELPESYFLRPPRSTAAAPYLYRSRAAATKRARESAEVRQRWFLEIFDFITTIVNVPEPRVDDLDFGETPSAIDFEDIEAAALRLRNLWGLGEGPIPNMLGLLEVRGCAVSRFAFGAEKLDSFSQIAERPSIALNADHGIGVRGRFDAAHELGHLVLHRRVRAATAQEPATHKLMEQQAHRFAGAFLFPASAFGEEVYSVTIDSLFSVKRRWRVSIQMMVRRARDLDLISQDQYERAFREISRRGFRKREPLDDDIPVETPKMLSKAISLLIDSGTVTRADLMYRLPFLPIDIEILTQVPRGYLESDRWGELVTLKPLRPVESEVRSGPAGAVIPFKKPSRDE